MPILAEQSNKNTIHISNKKTVYLENLVFDKDGEPMMPTVSELKNAVDVAAERQAADLIIKNVKLINVFSNEITKTNVAISGRLIAGIGLQYQNAKEIIDAKGRYLAPGLIDGHLHIESSLATPRSYAEVVLPKGITGVVCDPHEIGNVSGVAGINWLIDASQGLELDVWVTVPSSVPATNLETSGAKLGLEEIEELLAEQRVVGVAELMSFPDIIAGDLENLSKAALAYKYDKTAEGHAPSVSGSELQAYLATGISSDHESTSFDEGLEKLRSGVYLMIREGSVTRDLDALMDLIKIENSDRIGFVTDDRLPNDLISEGGVDCLLRRALAAGKDPAYAIRCASYNTALHYKLARRGAIAAGYFADMILISDLENLVITDVYKEGKLIAQNGQLTKELARPKADPEAVLNTVILPKLSLESFKMTVSQTNSKVRCIKASPKQILTEEIHISPKLNGNEVIADIDNDILKLVCIERHGKNGNIGLGLINGMGFKEGAIASTVGHDHHNLMAIGTNDSDLLLAVNRLEQIQGGFVIANKGQILAELQLEIAGLVSDRPLSELKEKLDILEEHASKLGNKITSPFMTLSFLGLEVIPELRVTDLGLVDVIKAQVVDLEVK